MCVCVCVSVCCESGMCVSVFGVCVSVCVFVTVFVCVYNRCVRFTRVSAPFRGPLIAIEHQFQGTGRGDAATRGLIQSCPL